MEYNSRYEAKDPARADLVFVVAYYLSFSFVVVILQFALILPVFFGIDLWPCWSSTV